MDRNVKIAKELVKLAKSMVADDFSDVSTLFDNHEYIKLAILARDTKDSDVLLKIVELYRDQNVFKPMIIEKVICNSNTNEQTLEIAYETTHDPDILSNTKLSPGFLRNAFSSCSSKAESPHVLENLIFNRKTPNDVIEQISKHNGYGWDDIKNNADYRLEGHTPLMKNYWMD